MADRFQRYGVVCDESGAGNPARKNEKRTAAAGVRDFGLALELSLSLVGLPCWMKFTAAGLPRTLVYPLPVMPYPILPPREGRGGAGSDYDTA